MNSTIENRKLSGIPVIAACFIMVFVCLGFCSSNKSLYLGAITEALNIKRSLFSINDTFRYAATTVVNLFFGVLIAKLGAKVLVGAGFASLIVSTLIYATAENVLVFYLGGMFLGIGLAWTSTTMVSYLVGRWFPEKRGTITGLALCANGIGGALAAQIVTPIIFEEGNPFGYRNAYHLIAIILAVVGALAVILIKEPKTAVAATQSKKRRGKAWDGISLQQALRKPYFYGAAVCVLLTGTALQGINGIAATHLGDAGIDKNLIATVLSVHSIVLCSSKFLAGFCYDKLGLRKALLICEAFGICSFLALALSDATPAGSTLAFVWGATSALALPLETVMVPLLAADLFGEKDYAKVMSIFVSINTAGMAIGTPVANAIFDVIGTYKPILIVIACTMLLILIAFRFIINAADKEHLALMKGRD